MKIYERNIHSQFGEDGVIAELFNRANINSGTVVEFGAWDGITFSNTYNLVKRGFSAIYIEQSINKYNMLVKNMKAYANVVPLNYRVEPKSESPYSIDNILGDLNVDNEDLQLMSIDVDSNDYQIWASITAYSPKFVIIETNTSFHNLAQHIHGQTSVTGSSPYSTYLLGKNKGYSFVHHTGNMFFARNDIFPLLNLNIDENNIAPYFRRNV